MDWHVSNKVSKRRLVNSRSLVGGAGMLTEHAVSACQDTVRQ